MVVFLLSGGVDHWQLGVFFEPVPVGLVRLQVAALVEALGAPGETAFVRLFACMDPNVSFEVEVDGKTLLAVWTFERTLSGVYELMSSQLGVVFKGLATDLALEIIHYTSCRQPLCVYHG